MKQAFRVTLLAGAALLLAVPASAHPGHDVQASLMTGLMHPLSGVDHVSMGLVIGLIAGSAQRTVPWLLLAALAASIAGGLTAGWLGFSPGILETLLAATLLLGLMLVPFSRVMPVVSLVGAIMAMGAVHGVAHGADVPVGSTPWSYALGVVATSLALALTAMVVTRYGFMKTAAAKNR